MALARHSWPLRICLSATVAVVLLSGLASTTHAEIPPPPDDPPGAKAYAVFDRHCASCHQAGKLTSHAPAGGLGDILDLAALARTPGLIRPGHPDGSALYTLMQSRMPPHEGDAADPSADPQAEDLDAVRDWIQRLPSPAPCPTATAPARAELSAAVAARVAAAGDKALNLRVLSTANVIGACAAPAEIDAVRQAVTITLNSLSWEPKPVVPDVFGPADSLLAIDLTAIGWSSERWARIARLNPYGSRMPGDPGRVVRADWFVATAWQPPVYYDLLGLPEQIVALTQTLGIDVAKDVASNRARRAALKTSAVTRNNRLVQRHPFVFGAYWTTSEFAPAPGRVDLLERPAAVGAPDASFGLFSLPNGFNAYFLANGEGARITDLPGSVARNILAPSRRLTAGGACVSCHAAGPRTFVDELRARAEADAVMPGRDRVLALHGPASEMAQLVAEDRRRVADAHVAAGLPSNPKLAGLSVVAAITARYERAVDAQSVAVELDLPFTALRDAARGEDAGEIAQRLLHGPIPRRVFEASVPQFVAAATNAPMPVPSKSIAEPFSLILTASETRYRVGETFSITARATEPCNLTLIAIDRNGRGTVIWPNDFETENRLEAGRVLRVPAADGPFQFRFDAPGRETIVGICLATAKTPSGIRHDFERQRFTELGDYRGFLNRTLANEPAARAEAQKADQQARANRRGIRRTDVPAPPLPRGEAQARASIQIEIVP